MHRKHLLESLNTYLTSQFFMEEERHHHAELIKFIHKNPQCFDRENVGHITGSVWLINHEQTHTLLTHHKKLGIWVQLGGHADGDSHIPTVALKEAHEESGIDNLTFITKDIYDIDIHLIPNKCKVHYDVRYLIKAPENAQYIVSEESHDLAWVALDKIENYTTYRSVLRMAEKIHLL